MSNSYLNIEELYQKITGIHSAIQRAVVIAEGICQIDSEAMACLFSKICVAPAQTKHPPFVVLAEAVFLSLIYRHWPQEHLRHTREAAAYVGDEVTLMFLQIPQTVDMSQETYSVPIYSSERVLTLGERKSIASMPSRVLIEKAMQDSHPDVAKKLLDNPRLTENDVVRISANSRMTPSALCQIASHPRWRRQPMVQKALVFNKSMPQDFALTLLPFLSRKKIWEISNDKRLHNDVQQGAKVLFFALTQQ